MTFETLLPLITLAAGFVLSGFGRLFSELADRSRIRGRALSYVVEARMDIHARVAGMGWVEDQGDRYDFTPEARAKARAFMFGLLPEQRREFTAKLYDALDDLAAIDPLLARGLRSGSDALTYIGELFLTIEGADATETEVEQALVLLHRLSADALSDLVGRYDVWVLRLARARGPVTWWRTRRYLAAAEHRAPETVGQFTATWESVVLPGTPPRTGPTS